MNLLWLIAIAGILLAGYDHEEKREEDDDKKRDKK